MLYRTYKSVRYRYRSCTGTGTGTDVHTGTGGTGMHIIPNLPNFLVPVLMYRTTEVSGTGIDVPNLPKCPVPVLVLYPTKQRVRYR